MPQQVSILSVGTVPLTVAPGVFHYMRSITYATETMFPRTVYLEVDKDTPEERIRIIAEDIEKAKVERPETLEIP